MEEVEEANRKAVECSHRVVRLLSQPLDQTQLRNIMVETGEAVFRFKRVVSLLNSGLGHARVRKVKKIQTAFPQNLLLDNPIRRTDHQPPQINFLQNPIQEMGSHVKSSLALGNPLFDTPLNGKTPLQLAQQTPQAKHHHFIQQQLQKQQEMIQLQQQQQQMKQQAEIMYHRSNSGINLNFDGSTCTPTMSSTRSFISSLSVDGSSVANLDGSGFNLIGAAGSSGQNPHQHKRRCSGKGDDGSTKCGSSGRCHCSKKRKHRVKRSIKVPAVSSKLADIPPDEYSWRKYGQKPIKGSPHPRFSIFSLDVFCILYVDGDTINVAVCGVALQGNMWRGGHFTIQIHHGGKFFNRPTIRYEGSCVDSCEKCIPDVMSLITVGEIVGALGYTGMINYYYVMTGKNINNRLRMLLTDSDVIEIIKQLPPSRTVDMYIEPIIPTELMESQTDEGGPTPTPTDKGSPTQTQKGCPTQTDKGSRTDKGTRTEKDCPTETDKGSKSDKGGPSQTGKGSRSDKGGRSQTDKGSKSDKGGPSQTGKGSRSDKGGPTQTNKGIFWLMMLFLKMVFVMVQPMMG
ncbi:hypothetical protein RHGRI_002883 [Rhododendron griersonianum]|uniref:WRKY domain-containing protein n=1 Tax=Rhododendron griersonianum TaxID=479676 RepID=A0AAV6LT90_9ERIC|nr:hypothetical protein RHGRI_002883 [Rhododendron griersonianum]